MPHFISIVKALDLTTPALLFPAISLLLLAYTNRFLSYASVVRNLKDKYESNPKLAPKSRAQIDNLVFRLHLTRWMQTLGASSLGLSVIAMFFIYIGYGVLAHILFGIGMLMLFASLVLCIWEIQCSVNAIELHIGQLPKSHSGGDVLARDAQSKQRSITEAQERRAQEQAKAGHQSKRKPSAPNKAKGKGDPTPKPSVEVEQERSESKAEAQSSSAVPQLDNRAKSAKEPKVVDKPEPKAEGREETEPSVEEKGQRSPRRTRGRGQMRAGAEQTDRLPQEQEELAVAQEAVEGSKSEHDARQAEHSSALRAGSESRQSAKRQSPEAGKTSDVEQNRAPRHQGRVRSRVSMQNLLNASEEVMELLPEEVESQTSVTEAEPVTIMINVDQATEGGRKRRRRARSNRVVLDEVQEEVSAPATAEAVVEVAPEVEPVVSEVSAPATAEAVVEVAPEIEPVVSEVSAPATAEAVVEVAPEVEPVVSEVSAPAVVEAVVDVAPEVEPVTSQVSAPAVAEAVVEVAPEVEPVVSEVSAPAVASLSPEAVVPTPFASVVEELKGELLRILNK